MLLLYNFINIKLIIKTNYKKKKYKISKKLKYKKRKLGGLLL
jgi:hypothetical protein